MYKEITSFGVDEEKETSNIIVILKQLSLNDFITEIRNSDLEIKNLSDEAVEALFDFIQDLKNDYNLDFILDLGFLNQKVREFFNYQQILKDYGLGINEIYKNGIVIELHNGNILFIKKYGF